MGKVVTLAELKKILLSERVRKKVVFTNGCFDLIHPGHVKYLKEAKQLGDVLVVGLNSDNSVKKLKGPSRPIISEIGRAEVLASLEPVDYVVIFSELSPERVIGEIKPDVHVKGGDYRKEELPEAKIVESYGGKVVIVKKFGDFSTSNLLEKIAASLEGKD
jgi:glycerol-3-phosphate cytidylyltransferase